MHSLLTEPENIYRTIFLPTGVVAWDLFGAQVTITFTIVLPQVLQQLMTRPRSFPNQSINLNDALNCRASTMGAPVGGRAVSAKLTLARRFEGRCGDWLGRDQTFSANEHGKQAHWTGSRVPAVVRHCDRFGNDIALPVRSRSALAVIDR